MRAARLDEVCEINPRKPAGLSSVDTASFLPMAGVSEEGFIDFEEERSVSELGNGYTYFERGDVLLAKITPCFENGKAARTDLLKRPFGFGSSEFHVLRTSKEVSADYLFHALWNVRFRASGMSNMTGSAGQKRVPVDFLRRHTIPLPPLEEQRRIAAILDKADALRRKRKRALTLLDGLTQSIFLEMFGDPRHNSDRWPLAPYAEACRDVTSSSSKVPRSEFLDEGVFPIVDQGQEFIAGWSCDESLVTPVSRPVVVFGDHTKIVKYVDFDFVIGADGAKVLRPTEKFEPRFFAELLRRMPIPNLGYSRHMRALKKLAFPVPPYELQAIFSQRIGRIDGAKEGMQQHFSCLDTLFTSLQSRAFAGEL